jgi:putative transposase
MNNLEIHNRQSTRLKGYDYSKAGLYFITICIKERNCIFGKIVDEVMILSDAGEIANEYWLVIPKHFPNAKLHEYVIMPNHIHGIIELTYVGVQNFEPLQKKNEFRKIIPLSIGSIIRGYKIGVTKWFRTNGIIHGVWQRNFYEHIIRNEGYYNTIAHYILNNPKKWKEDKFYMQQL